MTPKKQPDSRAPKAHTIAGDADEWMRRFVKAFELNVVDCSSDLPPNAGERESLLAAASAVFETFLDSGIEKEAVLELLAEVATESRNVSIAWTEALNQRRFELIDKEIQQSLALVERIELAHLTRIMRHECESELNLPMRGVQELHRKLLHLGAPGKHV